MKSNTEARALFNILPVGAEAIQSYEEFQREANIARVLHRARVRGLLRHLIDWLCRAYEALDVGYPDDSLTAYIVETDGSVTGGYGSYEVPDGHGAGQVVERQKNPSR